ncbi:MAG: SapC family protein, partial [Novosphingobium sp.]|uniref:SapC family protein n=1 Tax=Novosphingobium sp. TaxID=1874826 RepID=UPI003C7AA83B
MASAPQAANLPMFYKDLMPLNSRDHADWSSRSTETANWMVGQHAVPLTAEEFIHASRNYPIVFSISDNPVPLALMGLNEGVNTYFDDSGKQLDPVYVPAYARRYPFMLAKLAPDSDELSLCFDPTSDLVGEFEDGNKLFDNGQPTEACNATLEFCRNFEEAGFRTSSFVEELMKHDLLMDGEVSIQQTGNETPFVYRGFKMVDQEKLRELRG